MPPGVTRRGFLAAGAAGALTMSATEHQRATAAAIDPIPLDEPKTLEELNTPALIVDLDALESNLQKMAHHAQAKRIGLRPHTKTHKCPVLARKQLELGAVGVCAAKVSEAEVMAAAGIDDILITSPVVTPEKIARVIAVAQQSDELKMVVDNARNVRDFDDAARAAGIVLKVIIDLDTGTRRTGIQPGEPALELAREIAKGKNLSFQGLQAYAGHLMHITGHDKRRDRSVQTWESAQETKALLEKNGFEVPIFTGGGTGTFDIDCDVEGVTDLQVGSYLFMDAQYRAIGDDDSEAFDYFEPSLFVLVTAISQPVPELITVDGGYKAFSTDWKPPTFWGVDGLAYNWGGDEHGIVRIGDNAPAVKLGDKLKMFVPHCDPTVNLYDVMHPYRNGRVEELWPITARGHSQ